MQQTVEPPVSPVPETPPHKDHVMRGIVFALLAYFLFGIMQGFGKVLSETHHVAEIAFYRSLVAFIPFLAYILIRKRWDILKTNKPGAVIFRAVFGSIGLIVTFEAFHHLPMADGTVIIFTGIILTPAVAFFVLKEHIGWHRWSAILLGMLGVILMVRPSGDVAMASILIAFLAACMHSVINVTLRYLKSESSLGVTFYFILSGIIIPGLFMPFVAKMPETKELLLFLGVGISGGLAQYFLTSAFRMAPASLVAMFNYTGLIWATLLDIAIWNHTPTTNVFIGGTIILAANLYIVHRERVAEKNKKIDL